MAATRQLNQPITPERRPRDRSGRRIVGQACVADSVSEGQQVVGGRLRLLLNRESDHFPPTRGGERLRMRLAKVVAVRLDLVRQGPEDCGGITVGVGQSRRGRIRAPRSRTPARPHVADATPGAGSIVGSAAVSGSRAAVLRRNGGHVSSPSDEVGGYPARSARDVRAADLQAESTKRLRREVDSPTQSFRRIRRRRRLQREHRSERSEPFNTASASERSNQTRLQCSRVQSAS